MDFIVSRKHKLKGIILTHGHEDHIGALAWLVPYLQQVPLYGSEFTLRLAMKRLQERNLESHVELRPVRARERVDLGEFAVTFMPVCHSIIEGYGLGIETPAGRIVHTGDFKIDRNPWTATPPILKPSPTFHARACCSCSPTRPTSNAKAFR